MKGHGRVLPNCVLSFVLSPNASLAAELVGYLLVVTYTPLTTQHCDTSSPAYIIASLSRSHTLSSHHQDMPRSRETLPGDTQDGPHGSPKAGASSAANTDPKSTQDHIYIKIAATQTVSDKEPGWHIDVVSNYKRNSPQYPGKEIGDMYEALWGVKFDSKEHKVVNGTMQEYWSHYENCVRGIASDHGQWGITLREWSQLPLRSNESRVSAGMKGFTIAPRTVLDSDDDEGELKLKTSKDTGRTLGRRVPLNQQGEAGQAGPEEE